MEFSERLRSALYRIESGLAPMQGDSIVVARAYRQLEADNLRFIKANAEVAKVNADLVEENEDLKVAGQELVSRVEQFTNEWSKDA